MSPTAPPRDCSVTLPEVVDFHIKNNPDYPVWIFNEDGQSDITKVTYLEYGRACHRVAHKMRPGRRGPEGELIAIVAFSDNLLYNAVSVGLIRAGMVPFLMSPRNTAAAIIKMLKETDCHRLLSTQQTLKPLLAGIRSELASTSPGFELSIEEMPAFYDIYPKLGCESQDDPFEEYPMPLVRPPLDNVMLYLHSSGSTGFPKSIAETFRIMVHWASFPPTDDLALMTLGCMALPTFHTLGIICTLLYSMYGMSIVALYPPSATSPASLPPIPTPDNIIDHTRRTNCNVLISIPTLLQSWAQNRKHVEFLAKLDMVTWSGGSVPTKLGNFMTDSGVKLSPIFGGTEFGAPTYLKRRSGGYGDWEWISMDECVRIRWDPQGDGTYECQFLTSPDHQLSVENMPDIKGYASADLFIPHPTVPNFWKIVGRKDDVIIHSSGEKTVPAPMENIILNSPFTMGVVIFGREHDQAGVLIELKPTYNFDPSIEVNVIQGRNLMWPVIEEANRVAPAFSRIFKELIIFTSPNKPLPRAGKGTVMRKASLALYHEEIEALYASIESTVSAETVSPPPEWTEEATRKWLMHQVADITSGKVSCISVDLFEQGVDSLSSTILRRRIVGALQSNKETLKASEMIAQSLVYNYPSIEKLSTFLLGLIRDPDSNLVTTSRVDAIEEMISKYNVGFQKPLLSGTPENSATVLLTGTTGNLGSEILAGLLKNEAVKKIYALNRPSKDARARHVARFEDRGFDVGLLSDDKLVLLDGDITKKHIGLEQGRYQELLDNVNVIIHAAWRVDFNLQLVSFEPMVRGTRNLIDLAQSTSAGSSTKLLFTSSVASAFSWDRSRGPYAEEVLLDPKYAIGNGYGESKYVAERLITQSGVNGTSFRVGQISGGQPKGAWATTDWVPILVKSSIELNALPSMFGFASWLPMDGVAQSIIDVALHNSDLPPALNLVHPRPIPFDDIVSAINNALVQEGVTTTQIPVLPIQDWYSLLEKRAKRANPEDHKAIPAIKLLDFFRGAATVDSALRSGQIKGTESGGIAEFLTTKSQNVSTTMRNIPSLSNGDAQLWVKYWKSTGFFN
ncbi:putative NRPS-like protein biosynthetic cluster [Psilocybe cubensis]|uniref:Ketoreductase domain-containing protein n=2 Tax=Psilocybe cubensis TaxID=181762 RepID=A0A8H8CJP8_PSICU|nr:putative NRPS-like protein biosynthetic cluster [Psilocybe cubensis]KAH9476002.1 putative NRPS-like protein biosynthetic cluster [Psilocybe cubensis]